jgi:hypothetical protein
MGAVNTADINFQGVQHDHRQQKGKVVSQRPPQVSGCMTAQPFLTFFHSIELVIHSLGDPFLLPTVCLGCQAWIFQFFVAGLD